MAKIPLKHLSPSTNAFFDRLVRSGLEIFTSDDIARIACLAPIRLATREARQE